MKIDFDEVINVISLDFGRFCLPKILGSMKKLQILQNFGAFVEDSWTFLQLAKLSLKFRLNQGSNLI